MKSPKNNSLTNNEDISSEICNYFEDILLGKRIRVVNIEGTVSSLTDKQYEEIKKIDEITQE